MASDNAPAATLSVVAPTLPLTVTAPAVVLVSAPPPRLASTSPACNVYVAAVNVPPLPARVPEPRMKAKPPSVGELLLRSSLPLEWAAILVWVFLWRTVLGFEIRAVGQSESAARAAGIDPGRIRIIAMSLAGGWPGWSG